MAELTQVLPEVNDPEERPDFIRPGATPMNIHAANLNCHCRGDRPPIPPHPCPEPAPCMCKRPCCFRIYLDAGHEAKQGFMESAIIIDPVSNRKYFYDGDGTPLEMVSIEAFNSLVERVKALEEESE